MQAAKHSVSLSNLKFGDRAVITDIDMTDGNAAKLAARGIVPGASVGVLCTGDPFLIGIDNDRWALNRNEAQSIFVDHIERPRSRLSALLRRS